MLTTNPNVTDTDISRVINWCHEGRNQGTRYSGMTYEDGILAALDWLTGAIEEAPDED